MVNQADWMTKMTVRSPAKKVIPKIQVIVDMVIAGESAKFKFVHFASLYSLGLMRASSLNVAS